MRRAPSSGGHRAPQPSALAEGVGVGEDGPGRGGDAVVFPPDRAAAVEQDAVLAVRADRVPERGGLEGLRRARERAGRREVARGRRALREDGARVEVGRRVVRGRAEDADAARVRRRVRVARAGERGQERAADADDPALELPAERRREDPRIQRERDDVDVERPARRDGPPRARASRGRGKKRDRRSRRWSSSPSPGTSNGNR